MIDAVENETGVSNCSNSLSMSASAILAEFISPSDWMALPEAERRERDEKTPGCIEFWQSQKPEIVALRQNIADNLRSRNLPEYPNCWPPSVRLEFPRG